MSSNGGINSVAMDQTTKTMTDGARALDHKKAVCAPKPKSASTIGVIFRTQQFRSLACGAQLALASAVFDRAG
jgi:hypothetical protein